MKAISKKWYLQISVYLLVISYIIPVLEELQEVSLIFTEKNWLVRGAKIMHGKLTDSLLQKQSINNGHVKCGTEFIRINRPQNRIDS